MTINIPVNSQLHSNSPKVKQEGFILSPNNSTSNHLSPSSSTPQSQSIHSPHSTYIDTESLIQMDQDWIKGEDSNPFNQQQQELNHLSSSASPLITHPQAPQQLDSMGNGFGMESKDVTMNDHHPSNGNDRHLDSASQSTAAHSQLNHLDKPFNFWGSNLKPDLDSGFQHQSVSPNSYISPTSGNSEAEQAPSSGNGGGLSIHANGSNGSCSAGDDLYDGAAPSTPATSISIMSSGSFDPRYNPKFNNNSNHFTASSVPTSSSSHSRQRSLGGNGVGKARKERSLSRHRASPTDSSSRPMNRAPSQDGEDQSSGGAKVGKSRQGRRASVGPAAQAAAMAASVASSSNLRIDAQGAANTVGPSGAGRGDKSKSPTSPRNRRGSMSRGADPQVGNGSTRPNNQQSGSQHGQISTATFSWQQRDSNKNSTASQVASNGLSSSSSIPNSAGENSHSPGYFGGGQVNPNVPLQNSFQRNNSFYSSMQSLQLQSPTINTYALHNTTLSGPNHSDINNNSDPFDAFIYPSYSNQGQSQHQDSSPSSADNNLLQQRPPDLDDSTFSFEDLIRGGCEASDLHQKQVDGNAFSHGSSLNRASHVRTSSSTSSSTDAENSGTPNLYPPPPLAPSSHHHHQHQQMDLSFHPSPQSQQQSLQSIAGTQANRILEDVPERGRSKSSTRIGNNSRSRNRKNTSSVSASREREKKVGKGKAVVEKRVTGGRKNGKNGIDNQLHEDEDDEDEEGEGDEEEDEEEEVDEEFKDLNAAINSSAGGKKKAPPKTRRNKIVIDTTGMTPKEAEEAKVAERKKRRRESHNLVERRRRDQINDRITDLATLLPENMLLDAIANSSQGGNPGTFNTEAAMQVIRDAEASAKPSTANTGPFNAYAAALAPVQIDSAALAAAKAKPNKGIILRKSVDYIRLLQQFLDMQMVRNSTLEYENRRLREALSSQGMNINETLNSFPSSSTHQLGSFFGSAPAQSQMEQINFMDLIPEGQAQLLGLFNDQNFASHQQDDGNNHNPSQSMMNGTHQSGLPSSSQQDGFQFLPSFENGNWFQNQNQTQVQAQAQAQGGPSSSSSPLEERGRTRTRGNSIKEFSPNTKNRVKQVSRELKSHLNARVPSPSSLARESITREQIESQEKEVVGITSPEIGSDDRME